MPRRVRPEELSLWQSVASTTARLDTRSRNANIDKPTAVSGRTSGAKRIIASSPNTSAVLPNLALLRAPSKQPKTKFARAAEPFERLAQAPPKMDPKAHAKLKRGKLVPEARMDLHGMTLAEARPALTGFVMQAAAQGKRLVLVITGKGRGGQDVGPLPVRRGALKHAVPEWLAMPPLSSLVLQAVPAHIRHGGGGALYIYLKRNK